MQTINPPWNRRLRMALIGGGGSAFIGPVHVAAATLDRRADLTATVLSSDPDRSRQSAAAFGIAPDRAYGSVGELIEVESQRDPDSRIDFVTIATPNHTHFEMARAALEAGFHVVCEKPLTTDMHQADQLTALVEQTGLVFAVAYGYSGYPMIRQIRDMVRGGELGTVDAVRVSYIQGGLRRMRPDEMPTRAAWKLDPNQAGPSGVMADIGTHAFHLLRYTTDLQPMEISCHLATYHPVRPMEDYGHAVLRCMEGEMATLTVSQVTHGRLNDIALEIDGSTGSMVWQHEQPERAIVRRHGQPVQVYESNRRAEYLGDAFRASSRLPGGHPEGFFEALANIYRGAFDDMLRRAAGQAAEAAGTTYPCVADGCEGMRFVEACLASCRTNGWWQPY
ncbi:MAG: Gfo/Idh/MocA family oxidoreductase [Pirellulaceae bacterium]|nr:Gfo/Idh/MocA family oxidoreductase [Pirellulaceae bacterium]